MKTTSKRSKVTQKQSTASTSAAKTVHPLGYELEGDLIARLPIYSIRDHVIKLIAWEHTCNAYIWQLSSLFGSSASDFLVDVNDVITECYNIPGNVEEVYNTIERFAPTGDSSYQLTTSAEISEAVIFKLHRELADPALQDVAALNRKVLAKMLVNLAIVTRIAYGIGEISRFGSQLVFEKNDSNKQNFDCTDGFNFLFELLNLESKGATMTPLDRKRDECRIFIYHVVEDLKGANSMAQMNEQAQVYVERILEVIEVLTDPRIDEVIV